VSAAGSDRRKRGAQLLGELLLDRANVKVMMRYVGDPANLKLMMILLKDSSRSIQFEAFHVFKARGPRRPCMRRVPDMHSALPTICVTARLPSGTACMP